MKALDFSRIEGADDIPRAIQELVEGYNFERDLLNKCRDDKMDRVVAPLEDGRVRIDASMLGTVNYLILEWAERDVRGQLALVGVLEEKWKLRTLHHIATGLHQLHSAGIAHQDIKPSNVLVFSESLSKVADLGRAALKGTTGPADGDRYAGDKTYAPPELLYNHLDSDWSRRRFGCDAYLLGSMVMFFFTGLSANASLFAELAPVYHYENWGGGYEDVLPYLRESFGAAVRKIGPNVSEGLRRDLVDVVTQLCDPDLRFRGHPRNRIGVSSQYSLERYVAKFDLLARRAEVIAARSSR